MSKTKKKVARRAVVVGGMRTPFLKAFTDFTKIDTIGLGTAAVSGLLRKLDLPTKEIDSLYWGGVILPPLTVNIAREIALDLKMFDVEAATCTRACTSGLQAIHMAVSAIERGEVDVAIAGGSDSTSNAPIALPNKVVHAMAPIALGGKTSMADYMGAFAQLMPLHEILPRQPKIAERTTGEVMGESTERMAQRLEISREAQDEFTVRSHTRAAQAIASGIFDDEVTSVDAEGGTVHADGLVRANSSLEKLAKLRPVFSKDGTVTAANASPLTDGGAAVIVMEEQKARALGYKPLAAFRSFAYSAVDPSDLLLIGPAIAMPKALASCGMELSDVALVDMHEAFAAQCLSVLKMLNSKGWAKERLGRDTAVGDIDPSILNVHGGSLAIGHPFGATGARMVTTVANEMQRSDKETALLGICAAGGLGAAAVMERIDN